MAQSIEHTYDLKEYYRSSTWYQAAPIPATYTAYKLFEEKDGMPRSLVHGMPTEDGGRSRMFPLDAWIESEPGTPGFNCFEDPRVLVKYYPRFRVRAPRLVACRVQVSVPNVPRTRDNYQKYHKLIISKYDWNARIAPYNLHANVLDMHEYHLWIEEYATQQIQST